MSTPQEELAALRRMAELEDRAAGKPRPTEQNFAAVRPEESAQTAVAPSASMGDIVAGLPATRMAAGLAAPFVGALQAGAGIGDWISERLGNDPGFGKYLAEKVGEYEAAKKRGMMALGETPTDIAGLAGSVLTGGAAVKGIPLATSWGGKILQGGAVGAAAGATTPTSTPGIDQTMMQAAGGAAFGGGVPAVAPLVQKAGQTGYRMFVEPLTNAEAIKGRAYMAATGDKAPQIISELRNARQLVPGSQPTAGEAAVNAGRPEFSALQASAAKVLPTDYLARTKARVAAQQAQVGNVAGTEAQRAAADAARAAGWKQDFQSAMTEGIDQNMAKAIQPQIESLMSRPSMQRAQVTAKRLARERDVDLTDFGSLEGLDWLRKGLDNQISAAAKATSSKGKEDLAALLQTKADLLATIKEIAPKYNATRANFAAASKPINQMDVGGFLKDRLTPSINAPTSQRAEAYINSLRDAPGTIQKALTGAPRYQKLSDVLTPTQLAQVESVKDDLLRMAEQERMAQLGAQAGPNAMDVASQSVSAALGGKSIPNPLSRIATVANAIIGRVEGKIDKKLAIQIATEMLEPQVVAGVLEKEVAKAAAKKQTTDVLNKLRMPKKIASVNALVNANQGTEE